MKTMITITADGATYLCVSNGRVRTDGYNIKIGLHKRRAPWGHRDTLFGRFREEETGDSVKEKWQSVLPFEYLL